MLRRFLSAAALLAAAFSPSSAFAGDSGLNDLQIAHIAFTAGQIDIGYAEIAIAKTGNNDVRAFAETMLRDHTAVNEAAGALLAKLDASPEDNATSRMLLDNAAAKRAELSSLSGAAFDSAYAENELAYHQFVNQTLEETLIPATDNGELKALLETGLKTFRVHEAHAETLVESLK